MKNIKYNNLISDTFNFYIYPLNFILYISVVIILAYHTISILD